MQASGKTDAQIAKFNSENQRAETKKHVMVEEHM